MPAVRSSKLSPSTPQNASATGIDFDFFLSHGLRFPWLFTPLGPDDHIPRSPNAFMLYRRDQEKKDGEGARAFSQRTGRQWRELKPEERAIWMKLAQMLNEAHKILYPKYQFRPERTKTKPRRSSGNGSDGLRVSQGSSLPLAVTPLSPTSRAHVEDSVKTTEYIPTLFLAYNHQSSGYSIQKPSHFADHNEVSSTSSSARRPRSETDTASPLHLPVHEDESYYTPRPPMYACWEGDPPPERLQSGRSLTPYYCTSYQTPMPLHFRHDQSNWPPTDIFEDQELAQISESGQHLANESYSSNPEEAFRRLNDDDNEDPGNSESIEPLANEGDSGFPIDGFDQIFEDDNEGHTDIRPCFSSLPSSTEELENAYTSSSSLSSWPRLGELFTFVEPNGSSSPRLHGLKMSTSNQEYPALPNDSSHMGNY